MSIERKLDRDSKFKRAKLAKTKGRREALEAERRQADLRCRPPRNDLLPDLEIRQAPLNDLRCSPHRTRKVEPEHILRLMASIADFGFTMPILVAGGEIVDGHVRVEAARRLRLEQVPAIDVSHLSAADIRRLRLAANRLAELGEWDLDLLRVEFLELIDLDADLGPTGFTREEQDIVLLEPLDGEAGDEDEIDDPPPDPVTRIGDIWELGGHKIICGSALEAETYEQLMQGELADAVLTDAPYNVPIKGNVSGLGKKVHDEFVMASGELSDDKWQAFLDRTLALLAASVSPGAVCFCWMDWRSIHRLFQAGFGAGLRLINLIVWQKESGGMGSLYRSAHELVAVFCNGESPHTNNVELGKHGRNRSNVWCAPSANRRGSSANEMLEFHATPKPVELCVDAILDVTERGMTVLDAFLGSGTTLIAAEKTGRRCFGIELAPGFVDVAVRRWQKLTGRQAVLLETRETFKQVAVRRQVQEGEGPEGTDTTRGTDHD